MREINIETYRNLIKQSGGVNAENLFIILGKVQDTFGYVSREIVSDLAMKTGSSETQIYGALTSYRDFKVRPEVDC